MTRLSVNINKVALLRNSRGGNIPDPIAFALACEKYGADGITVHPRPDQRHIRPADVYALKGVLRTELNVEGYPSEEFLTLVEEVRPAQVTLVPDPPTALTSTEGWNIQEKKDFLAPILQRLKAHNIRVSIFIDPLPQQVYHAYQIGADCVELYTGPYAALFPTDPEKAIAPYIKAAQEASKYALRLHAGHDLNLQNLGYLIRKIPTLDEVSIGHAIIADCLYLGLAETLHGYKKLLL